MILMKIWRHIIAVIKKIIYKIINGSRIHFGKGVTFRKGFNLVIDKNGKVEIGDGCFFNNGCSINCLNSIKIGAGSIFGEDVKVYDHNHRFADFKKSIKEQGFSIGSVSIGEHCWIGSNVVILKGAEIGDNCVIGAGCVISGKVESGNIVKQPFPNAFVIKNSAGGYNMSDLVSIIVPVYKVEEILLRNSIESILGQTYSALEIIIVDDGSPDKCGEICDEYAEIDKRIKVFHTENGGVSNARNIALDHATGNYIFFVDSDDYIEASAIERLMSVIQKDNSDCAMCSANHIEETNIKSEFENSASDNRVLICRNEAIEALCYMEQPFEGYEFGAIWGCLYKRECIGEIRFNTKIKIGEDFDFKYRVLMNVNSVSCIEEKMYNYLIRNKSAMRNGFDVSKVQSVIELQKLLNYDSEHPEYQSALRSRITNIAIVILFMIPVKKEYSMYRQQIKSFLKENRKDVIANPKTRKKVKASLLLSYFGFDLIQILFFAARG